MQVVEQQLRELMAKGLTQADIAERVGLSQPTISRLLRGVHSDTLSTVAARIKQLHDEALSEAPKLKRPTKAKARDKAA